MKHRVKRICSAVRRIIGFGIAERRNGIIDSAVREFGDKTRIIPFIISPSEVVARAHPPAERIPVNHPFGVRVEIHSVPVLPRNKIIVKIEMLFFLDRKTPEPGFPQIHVSGNG